MIYKDAQWSAKAESEEQGKGLSGSEGLLAIVMVTTKGISTGTGRHTESRRETVPVRAWGYGRQNHRQFYLYGYGLHGWITVKVKVSG